MFGADVFWSAFDRAGMLTAITYLPEDGPAVVFRGGFKRPDQIVLDGMAHATDYSIEYQGADVQLARDAVVSVNGEGTFRVQRPPMAQGDGTFMTASLERIVP